MRIDESENISAVNKGEEALSDKKGLTIISAMNVSGGTVIGRTVLVGLYLMGLYLKRHYW